MIVLRKKLLKLRDKKEDLTVKFMRTWKTNIILDIEKINFELLKKEFEKIKNNEIEAYKNDPTAKKDAVTSLKIINELVKTQFDILDSEIKIEESKKKKREIKSVFVTFNKRDQKTAFFRLLPKSLIQNKLQCVQKFQIKENSIYVKNPPDPININWKNFNLKFRGKLARRCFSWFVFIAVFYIPVFMMIWFASKR